MSLRGTEPVTGASGRRVGTVCTRAHRADCTDRLVYVVDCARPGHEEARQMAVPMTVELGAGVGARAGAALRGCRTP